MPLFFVIAGINFCPEKFGSFRFMINKKYRTMILPYLFFCAFGVAYKLIYHCITHTLNEILLSAKTILFAIIWAPSSEPFQIFNTPLWFVPCLLLVEIMFYGFSKIHNKYLFWTTIVSVTSAGWYMESPMTSVDFSVLPWNLSTACFATGFFAVGNRLRKTIYKNIIEPELSKKQLAKLILLFVPAFLLTGYLGVHNPISMGSRELGNGFMLITTGLLGTLCVLIGSRIVQNSRLLNFFGKNSFAVMGFHLPVFWGTFSLMSGLADKLKWFPQISIDSMFGSIVLFLFVTVLTASLTMAYRKNNKWQPAKR